MQSWLAALPEHFADSVRSHLLGLFDWLVPVSLRFLRRELKVGVGSPCSTCRHEQ